MSSRACTWHLIDSIDGLEQVIDKGGAMTEPAIFVATSGPDSQEEQKADPKPIDERLQKALDKALYAGGNPAAQQLRNFLNGTWLGEPLHVVMTDIPVGAWTAAMIFDSVSLIGSGRKAGWAADACIAIGLVGAAGSAATGLTDWSD